MSYRFCGTVKPEGEQYCRFHGAPPVAPAVAAPMQMDGAQQPMFAGGAAPNGDVSDQFKAILREDPFAPSNTLTLAQQRLIVLKAKRLRRTLGRRLSPQEENALYQSVVQDVKSLDLISGLDDLGDA